MDIEGQELGPFEPVPDELVLAAIDRAVRHGAEDVWIATVGEHLGYKRTRHNTRRLREQLEQLRVGHGWADSEERHGREYWRLTGEGAQHLALSRAKGVVGDLPESPQHRTWRKARAAATERIENFKALLWRATEEASRSEGVASPPPSAWWFELSERLGAAFWLVGSALYCRDEWPEPSDEYPDIDPDPGSPPGRRAVAAWDEREAIATGDGRGPRA